MPDKYLNTTPSANDGNSGNSPSSAWRTWAYAIAHLAPGDTLWIGFGTYLAALVSGYSPFVSGTVGNFINVKNFNDEEVMLVPVGDAYIMHLQPSAKSYLRFTGSALGKFVFNGAGGQVGIGLGGGTNKFIEFINIEVENCKKSGVLTSTATDLLFRGVALHHNGTDNQDHGIYCGDASRTIIEDSFIYANKGWGIHGYTGGTGGGGSRYRRNKVYGNGTGGGGAGIIVASNGPSNDNRVEQNEVFDNNGSGIEVWNNNDNTVDNNLVHGNSRYGIVVGEFGNPATTYVRNNIAIGNGIKDIFIAGNSTGAVVTYNRLGVAVLNSGVSTTQNNNSTGAVITDECKTPNEATFSLRDYTLKPTANSIDAGMDIASFTTDMNGIPRLAGGYDQGPHEYVAVSVTGATTRNRRMGMMTTLAGIGRR